MLFSLVMAECPRCHLGTPTPVAPPDARQMHGSLCTACGGCLTIWSVPAPQWLLDIAAELAEAGLTLSDAKRGSTRVTSD